LPLRLREPPLSNDVPMSGASESNGRPSGPRADEGVLANLPRTRPQRSSPRRAAARKASVAASDARQTLPSVEAGQATSNHARPATAKAKTEVNPKVKAKPKIKAKAKIKAKPKPKPKAKPKANPKAKARVPRPAKVAATTTPPAAGSTRRSAPARAPVDEGVPRQGFESEMDRASGPVQPPGGAELVSSAAEILSELARASLSTGERLFKDALARLPL
jgi:hypothetical protein